MAKKIYVVEGRKTEDIEADSEDEAIEIFDKEYEWCDESEVVDEYTEKED
jgi:hypothetical protein